MSILLSVVIPTLNRRDLLREVLEALFQQTCAKDRYEIVVVSDGSTDGTAEMVHQLCAPVPVRLFEQPNRGWPAARNLGNLQARGEILLCLDDDVIASPQLVEEHLRSHRAGGECVVLGKFRLHRRLGQAPLIRFFAQGYEREYRRMEQHPTNLRPSDFYSGNVSIPREILLGAGGFDEPLGDLADADGELGYRLWKRGVPLVFNPQALGELAGLKDFDERCQRAYAEGCSAVRQHRKHPESVWRLGLGRYLKAPIWRRALRAYLLRHPPESIPVRLIHRVIRELELTRMRILLHPGYRLLFETYFWRGVQTEAAFQGGLRQYIPQKVPVLDYHLVCSDPPSAMERWSVTPEAFQRQMAYLSRRGYHTITVEQLWEYLTRGTALPPRPVCLTFDDGYRNNRTHAFPILARYGFSATVFLVADFLGGVNEWDRTDPRPALLSWEEILDNPGPTISFQSHSLSHKKLTQIPLEEAQREIGLSAEILSQGLGSPVDFFAYPYGKFDERIRDLAAAHGYKAAFSVQPGHCRPKDDLHRLKRTEIFHSDSMLDFILKLKTGYSGRGWLRRVYRRVRGARIGN